MKTPRCNFFLPRRYTQDHVLFHVILIVICVNVVITEVNDDVQDKITGRTDVGRTEVRENKIDEGQPKDMIHQRSRKITKDADSPALRSFLKNILKARDELKWIDRTASRINYRNGPYGTVYQREAMDERGPSNDDRLNSNKNLQYEGDNGENRWTRDYGVPRTNNEDSERLENIQAKRELVDTAGSLEKLKETVLELRENLTRRNDDLEKDKPIIKINGYGTFNEDGLLSKKSDKDERKKDKSFVSNRKHVEQSNTLANENENTNLVRLKEPKFNEEVRNFENQEKSVILLRKKRMNIINDFKNETDANKMSPNSQKSSLHEKTSDVNDYWRVNNYKEVSNIDDLIALQDKLLNYNSDRYFGKEIHENVKFKNPDRRLLSIVEKESKNHLFDKRTLLENDDENLEEDAINEATYETDQLEDENSLTNRLEELDYKIEDSSNNAKNSLQEFDGKSEREIDLIDKTRASELKRHLPTSLNRAKDPYTARVNMLIKQRIASKHRDDKYHVRKKRYPLGIIEYYDYDEEFENNMEDNRAKKDSSNIDVEFADENSRNSRNCTLLNKKNEHAEEQEKEEKKKGKAGNKEPKQQFIVDLGEARTKNETNKSGNSSKSSKSKVTFKENNDGSKIDQRESLLKEDEKSLKHSPMEWSDKNEAEHENGQPVVEHNLENANPEIILPKDSLEYIFRVPEKIERQIVDVIFNDVQPIDLPEYNGKAVKDNRLENELVSNKLGNKEYEDIDAVYDELKKIYDWDDNENKNGPRLKGDQRLYQEPKKNLEKETNATSGTDYAALKKTDDLFKGGIEQSDSFEGKSSPNSTTSSKNEVDPIINAEWKVIPVMETINDSRPKSSEVLRSVESERRTKLVADSGSPYENGKYLESLQRERNDNERFAIESNDMQESFVEPLDGMDDFDDIRKRFGRSLKMIDDRLKIKTELSKMNGLNETRDDVSTKSMIATGDVKNVERCNDQSNETMNANLSNLLESDNRNETIGNKPILKNEIRSGVNKINEIGSMNHSTLPSASNKNASRVKREGNSYSLIYEERNPIEVPYEGPDEIVNDFYTIDPYGYSVDNQNSRNYFDPVRPSQLKYEPIDFEVNDYDEGKKSSRHKFRNRKRKKKRRKKKRKKNANSRKFKKHSKNLNGVNRRFERKNRRKRKSRNSLHEFSGRLSKKGRKRKATKPLKDRERRKIKPKHGNSIKKIMSGASVLRDEDKSRMEGFEETGTRRKKLALLLTADNMEDESQMDLALHGELPGKIVENIFEQVQRNEALKVALGPGLYRKNKFDDSTDKMYLQNSDENKVRHTEKIMEKIMELLDRMVLDEVQKKTCVTLPSDMRQFLEWMLNVNGDEEPQEQAPLLPLIHDQETTDHSGDDKILFPKIFDAKSDYDVDELHKKVRILKNLINEYNALSAKEKIKVQTVHDYLVRQLNLLLHYIETKEKAEKEKSSTSSLNVDAARRKPGFILRYQSAVPKVESQVNTNEALSKSNNSIGLSYEHDKRRPIRSSNQILNFRDQERDKKRKRRKGKRKHRGKRYNITPEYRKLVHRAAIMRKKRANALEDEWNPFDFRYEEPEVYKSMSIMSDESGKRRDKRLTRTMQKREIVESNNATVTNLISNNIDPLPVKGKNRVEDEMILLNKREAWKKENERELEEVAFGKDMRNAFGEEEQFKKLIKTDNNIVDIVDKKSREKRENVKETMVAGTKDNFLNNSISDSTIHEIAQNEQSHDFVNIDTIFSKNTEIKNNTCKVKHLDLSDENKLKMLEKQINVYADKKNDTF